jgi:hypothetical protein
MFGYPEVKSIGSFMDQVWRRTKRLRPLHTDLIAELNPPLPGWAIYSIAILQQLN